MLMNPLTLEHEPALKNIDIGVANVRHSHVILTIRNTHIFGQQPWTQVRKLIRVSRIHYIAKNGTAQLPLIGF